MNLQNEKCVIVVDEELPLGIIANTAVILGITLGKTMPEAVGPDDRKESSRHYQIPCSCLEKLCRKT